MGFSELPDRALPARPSLLGLPQVRHSYECPYAPICFRSQGWDNPLATGKFRERTPHHAPEVEQLRACGYTVPVDEFEDEED